MTQPCANCGELCGPTDDWTEDDALAEAAETFDGEIPQEEQRVLCDDCYHEFMSWATRTYGPGPWPALEPPEEVSR